MELAWVSTPVPLVTVLLLSHSRWVFIPPLFFFCLFGKIVADWSEQQDTSVIRDKEIQSGKVGPCGRTSENGAIDMAAEMEGAPASF
jgi:hypothetical protein